MRRIVHVMFVVGAFVTSACAGGDDATDASQRSSTTTATTAGDGNAADASTTVPDDGDSADDSEPASTVPDGSAPAAADGEATLVLIEAGATPRRTLRLDLEVGTTQHVTMRQDFGLEQPGVGGTEDFSSRTVTETDVDLETIAVGEQLEVVSTYADARLIEANLDEVRQETEAMLAAVVGQTTTARMSARGEVLEVETTEIDTGDRMFEQVMDALDSQANQRSIPLPVEPVGVGAVWERSWTAHMPMGIEARTVVTFTLVELDGDRVSARQETRMVMSASGVADLEGELHGVGYVEWDLGLPIPLSSMELDGTITTTVSGVELEQTQHQVFVVSAR